MTHDAIVIGGGPAGSVTALRLAGAGWRVAVVERAAFPRRKVCGEYLSGTNWRMLRRVGVWDRFRDLAGPAVKRFALFGRAAEPAVAPLPLCARRGDADGDWGRALTRDRLDSLLLDEARGRGAEVLQPCKCVALDQHGDGWRCVAEASDQRRQTLTAPVVIAAHGAWSRGALPTLPPSPPAAAADLLGFKAHFIGARLASDLMPLLSFPGGYGGMVTCQGGAVSLSCCLRRGALDALRKRTSRPAGDAVLDHLLDSIPALNGVLAGARRQGDWLAAGPIRPGRRRLYGDGVFRVGNAAGEAHSVVAEGISMAMQSGWMAADCLVRACGAAPAATADRLDTAGADYQRLWRRGFGTRLRVASLVAAWAMRPALVGATQPLLRACPPVLTAAARLAGKSRLAALGDDRGAVPA